MLNVNVESYKNYGARGIKLCDEWLDYKTFEKWCLEHGYKYDLAIDRVNNKGDYEPNNCQFLTKTEHAIKTNKERTKPPIICKCCNKLSKHKAKGMCLNCYRRKRYSDRKGGN